MIGPVPTMMRLPCPPIPYHPFPQTPSINNASPGHPGTLWDTSETLIRWPAVPTAVHANEPVVPAVECPAHRIRVGIDSFRQCGTAHRAIPERSRHPASQWQVRRQLSVVAYRHPLHGEPGRKRDLQRYRLQQGADKGGYSNFSPSPQPSP